jgi:hypothetical protein
MKTLMDVPALSPAFNEQIEQTVAQMPATPKRSKALRQLLDTTRTEQPATDALRRESGPRRNRGQS